MTYKWRLKLVVTALLMIWGPVSFWMVFDRWPRGWLLFFIEIAAVILGLLSRPKRDRRTDAEKSPRILLVVAVSLLIMVLWVATELVLRWLL